MAIKCAYCKNGEIPEIDQRPPKSGRWFGACKDCGKTSGIKNVSERDGVYFGNAYRKGPLNPVGTVRLTVTIRREQSEIVDGQKNKSEFVQRALDEYIDKQRKSDILVV